MTTIIETSKGNRVRFSCYLEETLHKKVENLKFDKKLSTNEKLAWLLEHALESIDPSNATSKPKLIS